MGTEKELKPKQLDAKETLFVAEYLIDLDPKRAALAAGYSKTVAESKAYQWVSNSKVKPHVFAAIEERKQARMERLQIEQDDILRPLLEVLVADPNELVEHRRVCCRYCYGEAHRYQFTPAEWDKAIKDHDEKRALAIKNGMPDPGEISREGGIGYDARKPPVEDCPECFGEGDSRVHFKDTRSLSKAARALYAGTKISKGSIEIQMQNKEKAIELLGRHLGTWNDKLKLQGDKEDPLTMLVMGIAGNNNNGLAIVNDDPDHNDDA